MGGGLMQLVAYGAQDVYLTGNPQITFFKVVYRRHTNFSMEAIEQTWNGSSLANGRCTATISRNGDLVSRMYLEITTNGVGQFVSNPSSAAITSVEVEIGGQRIDRHSGRWLETYAELTEVNPNGCHGTAGQLNGTQFQNMSGMGGVRAAFLGIPALFFIPLQFWFCRNPGLALPLIALQYHEVKIILNHNLTFALGATQNRLWADYIYLDTDERRRFAQVSHEYLIEQVQEQNMGQVNTVELNFNHPVKELILTAATNAAGAPGGTNYTTLVQPMGTVGDTILLKLNGHDRFAARDHRYFSRTQVWQHHTGVGGLNSAGAAAVGGLCNDSICVYSFALKPEEHQPSGTCNFSRIDNAVLNFTNPLASQNTSLFAVNYNVLRIMSGMGGLAYSN